MSDHPVIALLYGRVSATSFDRERGLSEGLIRELIRDATQAPSSFNIQHWRFVCVRTPEDKKRLRELAYGQPEVEDAAVTFIVLGDVRAHERLDEILRPSVEAGLITRRSADRWIETSNRAYSVPQMARDEAIRSATLAAANLMMSAAARGLVSAPMIGFDSEGVKTTFEIGERYLPVMLLSVGHPGDDNPERKVRLDVDDVLAFDRGREF
ncbi:MAG: nitroreductase family protein [Acidobacteriota bacterium]|nr:nitroreductase family protein [Acidobacteriota bacterium]